MPYFAVVYMHSLARTYVIILRLETAYIQNTSYSTSIAVGISMKIFYCPAIQTKTFVTASLLFVARPAITNLSSSIHAVIANAQYGVVIGEELNWLVYS